MRANLSIISIPPNHVADIYVKLKNITELHNTSVSIAFIKKVLFADVIPKFAVAKGQFIKETDNLTASHMVMKKHLTQHVQDLHKLSIQYNDLKSLLCSNVGIVLVTH